MNYINRLSNSKQEKKKKISNKTYKEKKLKRIEVVDKNILED